MFCYLEGEIVIPALRRNPLTVSTTLLTNTYSYFSRLFSKMISNPTELSVVDNVVLPVPVSKPRKKVVYDVLPSYESQEPVVPATAETDPAGLVSVLIEAANTKPVIQAPVFRKKKAITVKDVVNPLVDSSENPPVDPSEEETQTEKPMDVPKPKTKKSRVPKKTPETVVAEDPLVDPSEEETQKENPMEVPKPKTKKPRVPKKTPEPVVVADPSVDPSGETQTENPTDIPIEEPKPNTKKTRVPKKTPQPIVVSDPVVIEFKDELKEDNYVAPSGVPSVVPLVDDTDEEILVETILIHGKTYYIAQDNRLFSLSLNLVGVFHENKDDAGGFIQYYSKDTDSNTDTTPI